MFTHYVCWDIVNKTTVLSMPTWWVQTCTSTEIILSGQIIMMRNEKNAHYTVPAIKFYWLDKQMCFHCCYRECVPFHHHRCLLHGLDEVCSTKKNAQWRPIQGMPRKLLLWEIDGISKNDEWPTSCLRRETGSLGGRCCRRAEICLRECKANLWCLARVILSLCLVFRLRTRFRQSSSV